MASSTKYDPGTSRLLTGNLALTDHALDRWHERTPHDCPVTVHQAYRRGEYIKHPQVAQSDGHDEPPAAVRVYKHGMDWGVAMLVVPADDAHRDGRVGYVVSTIIDFDGFDHGPSRTYLHSHGPHNPGGDE